MVSDFEFWIWKSSAPPSQKKVEGFTYYSDFGPLVFYEGTKFFDPSIKKSKRSNFCRLNFAGCSLYLFFAPDLSRKTEGLGPLTSWQPGPAGCHFPLFDSRLRF